MLFFNNFWNYIALSAPFFLFGLFLAGVIKTFISMEQIKRSLGKKSSWGFVKAAFVGIPLPLCSCSVIPTAITLKKSGASNASTSAFLIATPESGIDSISFTYAVMDLPMTIIRPVAAFVTAIVAGIFQQSFNDFTMSYVPILRSCCSSKSRPTKKRSPLMKILNFAFSDIIDDIAFWMLIGIILGAGIQTFIPTNIFIALNGIEGKFVVLFIGIPLYICASSSTPLAAALIMKGMSPGTALILLLTGPATNISNLLVLRKYIGGKGVIINVLSISVVAFGGGVLTDWLYHRLHWPLDFPIHYASEHIGLGHHIAGIILLGLLLKGIYKKEISPLLNKSEHQENCCG